MNLILLSSVIKNPLLGPCPVIAGYDTITTPDPPFPATTVPLRAPEPPYPKFARPLIPGVFTNPVPPCPPSA
jgi:hypothetical protein